jgi:hypothetical protein
MAPQRPSRDPFAAEYKKLMLAMLAAPRGIAATAM